MKLIPTQFHFLVLLACSLEFYIPLFLILRQKCKMLGRTKQNTSRSFKKGIDAAASRRKREEATAILRSSRRNESIQKRRNLQMTNSPAVSRVAAPSIPSSEIRLDNLDKFVALIRSQSPEEQLQGTTCIRKMLSKGYLSSEFPSSSRLTLL